VAGVLVREAMVRLALPAGRVRRPAGGGHGGGAGLTGKHFTAGKQMTAMLAFVYPG